MDTSVGTKARKKQPSISAAPAAPALSADAARHFEQALLGLENACLKVSDAHFAKDRDNMDALYWQERFRNIVKRVSLGLAQCKGPRRFHYHYRHRTDDDSVLHPVLENPVDMLAQVCRDALRCCHTDLVGMETDAMRRARNMFENALQNFLQKYKGIAKL